MANSPSQIWLWSLTAKKCQSRDYGNGGTVCVCNSTYCDTISTITKVDSPNYIIYTSNKAGLRFNKSRGKFSYKDSIVNNGIYVGSKKYQSIIGFGGALTDAAGINILSLNDGAKQNLMRSYFGPDGIGYNLVRIPIGATDFSTHVYSYDDTPFPDPDLEFFTLAPEDYMYKIPLIQEAQILSNNSVKLIALAWTAPKWMKVIPNYVAMFGELKREMYQSYANYHLKFLDAYDANNITFWAISTVNEPSVGYTMISIPTLAFTASLLAQWLGNNLGPTLKNSKYSNLKIIALEDERIFLPWFMTQMFENSAAKKYVDGIGVHWYFDKLVPPFVLDDTHKSFPDKFIMGTEACKGQWPWEEHVLLGSWVRGEEYIVGMIENLKHWFAGWIDWNLALNEIGGPTYVGNNVDAPIIVNASAGEFYKEPMFYTIGHISKFVTPGSVRIDVTSANIEDIITIGFKRPDEGIVVIVVNRNEKDVDVTIVDSVRGQTKLHLSRNSVSTVIYW